MPWNPAQIRLFAAAAHDPEIARKNGIGMKSARRMMMEAKPKQRSAAMRHPVKTGLMMKE